MDKLDIYYRALVDFRKNTLENSDCVRQRKAIARANESDDVIEVEKTECEIEDDWIEAIEIGLEAIGKAIAEERQFILSNGEVVPIEKVKNVSKESVEHLARHSDLITRVPEGDSDLIPDKLYTVERLTDFAVYENRFLYMLLCYLRDFISVRYNAILELVTTYSGKMSMRKTIHTGNRHATYSVSLNEKVRGDEFLLNNNPSKSKIDRIDGLLKAVLSYLATPLMDEVSKAPMLKPPITETNVLKMNRNFKAAVQLYYFVTSYTKKGYSYTKTTNRMNPFKEQPADEIAETVELTSFLTYEYGMGIQDILKANYQEQLKLEKQLAEQRKLEQIKSLRKRIRDAGVSPEEYMLLLEQRNKTLEADSLQLAVTRAELAEIKEVLAKREAEIAELKQEIERLNTVIAEKEAEIVRITEEYEQRIADLTAEYEQKIADLTAEYEQKIADLTAEYEQKIADLTAEYEQKIADLTAEYEQRIADLTAEYEQKISDLIEEHTREIEELNAAHAEELERLNAEYAETIDSLNEKHRAEKAAIIVEWSQKLVDEKNRSIAVEEGLKLTAAREKQEYEDKLAALTKDYLSTCDKLTQTQQELDKANGQSLLKDARLNALKQQSGIFNGDEDYISREGFDELERQYYAIKAEYTAFRTLYNYQWKLTKRDIRKKYLKAAVPEKKKKNKNGGSGSDNAESENKETSVPETQNPASETIENAVPETTETEAAERAENTGKIGAENVKTAGYAEDIGDSETSPSDEDDN